MPSVVDVLASLASRTGRIDKNALAQKWPAIKWAKGGTIKDYGDSIGKVLDEFVDAKAATCIPDLEWFSQKVIVDLPTEDVRITARRWFRGAGVTPPTMDMTR